MRRRLRSLQRLAHAQEQARAAAEAQLALLRRALDAIAADEALLVRAQGEPDRWGPAFQGRLRAALGDAARRKHELEAACDALRTRALDSARISRASEDRSATLALALAEQEERRRLEEIGPPRARATVSRKP